eukprot:5655675-Prymnesium_polylepis.1
MSLGQHGVDIHDLQSCCIEDVRCAFCLAVGVDHAERAVRTWDCEAEVVVLAQALAGEADNAETGSDHRTGRTEKFTKDGPRNFRHFLPVKSPTRLPMSVRRSAPSTWPCSQWASPTAASARPRPSGAIRPPAGPSLANHATNAPPSICCQLPASAGISSRCVVGFRAEG